MANVLRYGPLLSCSLSYDPISYDYNAVYKFKPHDQFKVKAGCDKSAGLAWASVWVSST